MELTYEKRRKALLRAKCARMGVRVFREYELSLHVTTKDPRKAEKLGGVKIGINKYVLSV